MTLKLYHNMGTVKCNAVVLQCVEKEKGCFDILLDQTAIYPEGGGQLSDTGRIGDARVLHAREDKGEIWHLCNKALAVGATVDVEADALPRMDHTQQHTGEHMLSGLANTMFGCQNVGFHMNEDVVTVDFDKQLDGAQVKQLETAVNIAIQRNEPTVIKSVTAQELERMDIRKKAKGLTGEITVVYAGGVDSCTCCGTHCKSAGEVGLLKILSHMNYKGGTRITFLCGMRAISSMQQDSATVNAIANRFSTATANAAEAVMKQGNDLAQVKKELKTRTEALLAMLAEQLYDRAQPKGGARAVVAVQDGLDMHELGMFAEKLCIKPGVAAVLFSQKGEQLYYRAARSKDVELSMKELIQAVNGLFGGKGGGRDDSAQGSAPIKPGFEESIAQLKSYLEHRVR